MTKSLYKSCYTCSCVPSECNHVPTQCQDDGGCCAKPRHAPTTKVPAAAHTRTFITPEDSIAVQYSVHGDPNAQRKILLVMGIMTPKDEFELLVPHLLSDSDTQVVTLNNRGIYPTTTPLNPFKYSSCLMARDTLALLQHMQWTSGVHVMGLSMGGMIATELALAAPQGMLASLALVATHAGGWRSFIMPKHAITFLRVMLSRDERTRVRLFMGLLYHDTKEPWPVLSTPRHKLDAYHTHHQRRQGPPTAPSLLGQLRTAVLHYVGKARLVQLRAAGIPTLVVVGTRDKIIPSSNSHELAEALGARLAVLVTASHMLSHERPRTVAALMLDHASRAEEALGIAATPDQAQAQAQARSGLPPVPSRADGSRHATVRRCVPDDAELASSGMLREWYDPPGSGSSMDTPSTYAPVRSSQSSDTAAVVSGLQAAFYTRFAPTRGTQWERVRAVAAGSCRHKGPCEWRAAARALRYLVPVVAVRAVGVAAMRRWLPNLLDKNMRLIASPSWLTLLCAATAATGLTSCSRKQAGVAWRALRCGSDGPAAPTASMRYVASDMAQGAAFKGLLAFALWAVAAQHAQSILGLRRSMLPAVLRSLIPRTAVSGARGGASVAAWLRQSIQGAVLRQNPWTVFLVTLVAATLVPLYSRLKRNKRGSLS